MSLKIVVVSDKKTLLDMGNQADAFLIEHSVNPFLLSPFLLGGQHSVFPSGSTPLVLFFSVGDRIVGFVPLLIKRRFGIQSAQFLLDGTFTPDFIFDDQYRTVCMEACLDFIFNGSGCKFASFNLPRDSINLPVLRRLCEKGSVVVRADLSDKLNHAVIPVQSSWQDYQKGLGGKDLKWLRRMERSLWNAGKFSFKSFINDNCEQDVLKQIMEIEGSSWKEVQRLQHNIEADGVLLDLWAASSAGFRTFPDFKRIVWFLYVRGQPIAYSFVIQFKETAYICKTSYKNKFRHFSPGNNLRNVVIRELFDFGEVKLIDLLTDLPVHRRWTNCSMHRVRLLLLKGFLPNLYNSVMKLPQIRKVMAIVVGLFRLDV